MRSTTITTVFLTAVATAMLVPVDRAADAAIMTLPGLTNIRFWEYSGGPIQNNFAPASSEMTAQLGVLSPISRDFDGVGGENYDVFYSDANGAFNLNGNYVTIDAVYPNASGGGGLNIAAVDLMFGSSVLRADTLTNAVGMGTNYIPLSEFLAVDPDAPTPATFTTMGNTAGVPGRLSITVGWRGIPEPASAMLMLCGVLGAGWSRRRRIVACVKHRAP